MTWWQIALLMFGASLWTAFCLMLGAGISSNIDRKRNVKGDPRLN